MEKAPDCRSMRSLASSERPFCMSLDRSRALATSLTLIGSRFDKIHRRLPSLTAATGHIDRAARPAAAVLKVIDATRGLEAPLLGEPRADLPSYLSLFSNASRRSSASSLKTVALPSTVQWLCNIVEYLIDHYLADSCFLPRLKSSLELLKSFSSAPWTAAYSLPCGDNFEEKFHRLLADYSSPLPVDVISKLHAIL